MKRRIGTLLCLLLFSATAHATIYEWHGSNIITGYVESFDGGQTGAVNLTFNYAVDKASTSRTPLYFTINDTFNNLLDPSVYGYPADIAFDIARYFTPSLSSDWSTTQRGTTVHAGSTYNYTRYSYFWTQASHVSLGEGDTPYFSILVNTDYYGLPYELSEQHAVGTGYFEAVPVPEPSTIVLFAIGVIGLFAFRSNRQRNSPTVRC